MHEFVLIRAFVAFLLVETSENIDPAATASLVKCSVKNFIETLSQV